MAIPSLWQSWANAQRAASSRAAEPRCDRRREAYSDDQGSVDRRGLIGKVHKGDLDPAFSAAAFALRVGGVSDVIETRLGFHIIKRRQ